MPLCLFLFSGRWDWWQGWTFFGVTILMSVISRGLIAIKNPGLIKERAGFTASECTKDWDKKLVQLVVYMPLLPMLISALNLRFGWLPQVPFWLQMIGLAGIVLGMAINTWAMLVNRFFSSVVRIQTDRGHSVISQGPYHVIRHPGYASAILANLSFPFLLGSYWAQIAMFCVIVLIIIRTILEDRTLQSELPGYREYATRVHYRLMPGVW